MAPLRPQSACPDYVDLPNAPYNDELLARLCVSGATVHVWRGFQNAATARLPRHGHATSGVLVSGAPSAAVVDWERHHRYLDAIYSPEEVVHEQDPVAR